MPVGGGFAQASNAQAALAAGSLLVVANAVTQAVNDQQQIAPVRAESRAASRRAGQGRDLLADSGYCSAANVAACAEAKATPLIALGRERHHRSWKERFAPAPPPPDDPAPLQAMAHRLATPEGRRTCALRTRTPQPVFSIIKAVMGFRQFSLRGLQHVKGEWNLVTRAWT